MRAPQPARAKIMSGKHAYLRSDPPTPESGRVPNIIIPPFSSHRSSTSGFVFALWGIIVVGLIIFSQGDIDIVKLMAFGVWAVFCTVTGIFVMDEGE
jgi:uncharacterized membrane protein